MHVALHVVVFVNGYQLRPPSDALIHDERDVGDTPVAEPRFHIGVTDRFAFPVILVVVRQRLIDLNLQRAAAIVREFADVDVYLLRHIRALRYAGHRKIEIRVFDGRCVVFHPRFTQHILRPVLHEEHVEAVTKTVVLDGLVHTAAATG